MSLLRRCFSTNTILRSKKPIKLKASGSSQEWLRRQMADPYVEKARMQNLRCRSAFKLIEIDDKYKILYPGQTCIDCGASPGSWSQVATRRTNADQHLENRPVGTVIGVDLLPIYPLKGATFLNNMDFTTEKCQKKILELLGDKKVNCILSDMAPNATGVRVLDHENIMILCESVLSFAMKIATPESSLLLKVWDNGQVPGFVKKLEAHYKHVKAIKPNASRGDSSEKFILARQFNNSISS